MSVNVTASVAKPVNFAAASVGKCSIVSNVKIDGCDKAKEVFVKITTEPDITYEYKEKVAVADGKASITKVRLTMNDDVYRKRVREIKEGNVKVEVMDVEQPDTVIGIFNAPLHMEPYLHWNDASYSETLACWVTPNQVEELATLAAKNAAAQGVTMSGYQRNDVSHVEAQIRYACEAFSQMEIPYMMPPASYEITGQVVRPGKWVLQEQSEKGTCIDLAVTQAALMECIGFDTYLVVTRNHAFIAVSKTGKFRFPKALVRKEEMNEEFWKKINDDLIPIECTSFTAGKSKGSYEQSTAYAKTNMSNLQYMIDVHIARNGGMLPVFSAYEPNPVCGVLAPEEIDVERATTPVTKLDILKKQSMNISYRNKMLNGKVGNSELKFPFSMKHFMSQKLEDEVVHQTIKQAVLAQKVSEKEFNEKLNALLIENRKHTKTSGYSKLNFVIGSLKFTDEEGKKYEAPLYTCLAEIFPNKRNEFIVKLVDQSKMRFNPVLKELLSQEYGIDVSDLKDCPGEGYKKELEKLAYRIEKQDGWTITEDIAHLGIFNIPNEAISKGLSDERVTEHPVNQGILNENISYAKPGKKKSTDCVFPFKADHSQREIIETAFTGGPQVIVGSAGNGKTTTIANISAKAYVDDKAELSIAQQDAAHSVHEDKMEEIGLGKFFLKITRTTSNYQSIATKVEEAIRTWEEYEKIRSKEKGNEKRFKRAEAEVKEYYHLMKERLSCGKTPEQLLEMMEEYRDCDVNLKWTVKEKTSLDEMERIVEEFADVLAANKFAGKKYADFLRYEEMTSEERTAAKPKVEKTLEKGSQLISRVGEFECFLQLPHQEEAGPKPRLERVIRTAKLLSSYPNIGKTPEAKQLKEHVERLQLAEEDVRELAEGVARAYQEYATIQKKTEKTIITNEDKFKELHSNKLKMMLFKAWLMMYDDEADFAEYRRMKAEAKEAGMEQMLNQLEDARSAKNIGRDDMLHAFKKCWCKHQIENMSEESPELAKFSQIHLYNQMMKYEEEDKNLREDVRAALLDAHIQNLNKIKDTEKYRTELANLKKLVRQRKKGSIRSFFEQAPHMMQKLFPCMSMTPEAVAEFLPLDYPKFDLVIIDEASQLPTYKALIPISLGKENCLFFGDERQLAVAKSFVKLIEDEDGDHIPLESVLEAVIIANAPHKVLKTHYRSESEALFAFPLAKYYGNVVSLPDSQIQTNAISYEYVDCKDYDRSRTRTNPAEAACVVKKVNEYLAKGVDKNGETIGVLTVNINQKNLIQTMLIQEAESNEMLHKMMMEDRLTVLNLEESQGKEMDHVILSFGNGYDKNGKFSCNFGGFIQDGGKNRLNTFITRQKKTLHVITSMTPEMLADSDAEGICDLREFLSYAKGDMNFDKRKTTFDQGDTSMAETIAERLREMGYTVHTNIGSSKCKVDIGIVSPEDQNRYVLGIMLDHFEEPEEKVYDREVIYPDVLRRKGWNIYRLHTLSWYKNPEKELERISLKCG